MVHSGILSANVESGDDGSPEPNSRTILSISSSSTSGQQRDSSYVTTANSNKLSECYYLGGCSDDEPDDDDDCDSSEHVHLTQRYTPALIGCTTTSGSVVTNIIGVPEETKVKDNPFQLSSYVSSKIEMKPPVDGKLVKHQLNSYQISHDEMANSEMQILIEPSTTVITVEPSQLCASGTSSDGTMSKMVATNTTSTKPIHFEPHSQHHHEPSVRYPNTARIASCISVHSSVSLTSSDSSLCDYPPNTPICKFCHQRAKPNDPLISPCYCKGTIRYMHCRCLMVCTT